MTKKVKVTKAEIASAMDSIVSAVESNYSDFNSRLESMDIDDRVVSALFRSGALFSEAVPNNWYRDRVINVLLRKNAILGSEILYERISSAKAAKENAVTDSNRGPDGPYLPTLLTMILRAGYYSDISALDDAALYLSGEPQRFAVDFCSVDALRKMKDVRDSKVRRVVYQRLGPVECLDEMISDKTKDIRYEGVSRAPLGYKKLDGLVKEIARDVFGALIEKIEIGTLPMLLANRNIKNSWIASRVQARLDSGK